MKRTILNSVITSCLALSIASTSYSATSVSVYGEGTYNNTDLNVTLFADIAGDESVLSAGLSLHYDPAQIEVVDGDKDESIWYFGDPNGTTYQYFKPTEHITNYTDTNGKAMAYIPIIVGKLDTRTGMALDGVSGTKVPLGTVNFNYPAGSGMPGQVTSLTIMDAKPEGDGSFKSFVTVGQVVLDDIPSAVAFGSVALSPETPDCPGDLNGDNVVNGSDFVMFKGQWGGSGSADFNDDGIVNGNDFILFKTYWGTCN